MHGLQYAQEVIAATITIALLLYCIYMLLMCTSPSSIEAG